FLNQWLPADTGWAWLRPLLWLLAVMMFLVMGFFSFTIVGNLIASPFNAILAARTELLITGKSSERLSQPFAVVAKEAISSELFKLRYLIVRLIPLLILTLITSWIPMINLFVSSLWLVFGAWFLAIEYIDYPMANNQLNAKEQLTKLKAKRIHSLSFGAGTSLLMMFLGPLAMPSATIGATRYWVNQLKG
ncbi:MAG: sulfate transporter CysZ, partial [Sedimenticolaceae bacterium]